LFAVTIHVARFGRSIIRVWPRMRSDQVSAVSADASFDESSPVRMLSSRMTGCALARIDVIFLSHLVLVLRERGWLAGLADGHDGDKVAEESLSPASAPRSG